MEHGNVLENNVKSVKDVVTKNSREGIKFTCTHCRELNHKKPPSSFKNIIHFLNLYTFPPNNISSPLQKITFQVENHHRNKVSTEIFSRVRHYSISKNFITFITYSSKLLALFDPSLIQLLPRHRNYILLLLLFLLRKKSWMISRNTSSTFLCE